MTDEIELLRSELAAAKARVATADRDLQEWQHRALSLEEVVGTIRDERDALRADAERYRWLRVKGHLRKVSRFNVPNSIWYDLHTAELDAAIDRERK